jgi:pyridoxamine 5'-phosphate oxidase-like protein
MQPHTAATGQRRGGAIAMTASERDGFLRTQPVCRVATVGLRGRPHVSALWFVWDGHAVWLNSLTRSQRWTDLSRDPQVSLLVDAGDADFAQLRGIELSGRVEVVGEVPRRGEPVPDLVDPERLFADKYMGGDFRYDGRHAWLRLVPQRVVSWDFAKLRARG